MTTHAIVSFLVSNHLFQTASVGAADEHVKLTEAFAPSALRLLSDWIVDQTARPRP